MGGQLPGPLCKLLKTSDIDPGTLCRNKSPAPGPLGVKPSFSSSTAALKKFEYLGYARSVSYAMQAKSEGEDAGNWIEQKLKKAGIASGKSKSRRVQSFLGGAFLRMYLDGEIDTGIIAKAGVEIGESPEFSHLSEELNKFLQARVDHLQLAKAEPDKLLVMADRHLKAIKAKTGIAFRYTLNAVIGGVTGVAVDSVTHLDDVTTPKGIASKYRVGIAFSDTYDFNNKRDGEYDRFRKQLSHYLNANDFEKFETAYSREAHHPFDKKIHKTHLDNAAVFASYMYALEQKKWTPGGLDWEVTVPTEITLVFKAPHQASSAHKPPRH